MRVRNILPIAILLLLSSCGSWFSGPRELDWKEEWKKSEKDLKALTQEIISHKDRFPEGNNDFPKNFDYPFDDGFFIDFGLTGYTMDIEKITIKYYIDRGLLDHFSAFIFTTDSTEMKSLDMKVGQDGNDFKLEENWYIVND